MYVFVWKKITGKIILGPLGSKFSNLPTQSFSTNDMGMRDLFVVDFTEVNKIRDF